MKRSSSCLFQVPYPAANLYEAMYMYGVFVNMTRENGDDLYNGSLVASYLWGKSFTSKICQDVSL